MTRVTALAASIAHAPIARLQEEIARTAIVCGCALALISAGSALPF